VWISVDELTSSSSRGTILGSISDPLLDHSKRVGLVFQSGIVSGLSLIVANRISSLDGFSSDSFLDTLNRDNLFNFQRGFLSELALDTNRINSFSRAFVDFSGTEDRSSVLGAAIVSQQFQFPKEESGEVVVARIFNFQAAFTVGASKRAWKFSHGGNNFCGASVAKSRVLISGFFDDVIIAVDVNQSALGSNESALTAEDCLRS